MSVNDTIETKRLEILLKDFKKALLTYDINYVNIPVTLLKPTPENRNLFNEIIHLIKLERPGSIPRTPGGGIKKLPRLPIPGLDVTQSKMGYEALFYLEIYDNVYAFRMQFRASLAVDKNNKPLSGKKAFAKFKNLCDKYGIDLSKYELSKEDGYNTHVSIQKPWIFTTRNVIFDNTYDGAYHLDLNSAYASCLAELHPEFKELVEYLFENRHTDEACKAILNYSIGMMHSRLISYKYAGLAKECIEFTNKKLHDLTKRLNKAKMMVLAYNTDGIWYCGDHPFRGKNYGHGVGQYKNDYIDCTIRFRTKGCYEFIGRKWDRTTELYGQRKYVPVVRGNTSLDKIKPRTEWVWGDIYKGTEFVYTMNDEDVIVEEGM